MEHQMLLITALVILIMGAIGYWKGFLKMALSIAALALSFVIVLALNPHVASFLRDRTPLYENTRTAISEVLVQEEDTAGETLTQGQQAEIEEMSLPQSWKDALVENYSAEKLLSVGAETFSEYVSAYLAEMVVTVAAFVLTFLLVSIGIHILMLAFDIIGRLPVIHGANKTAGAIVGLVFGLVLLWVFNMILGAAAATGAQWAVNMMAEIRASALLSFLYNGGVFSKLAELLLAI